MGEFERISGEYLIQNMINKCIIQIVICIYLSIYYLRKKEVLVEVKIQNDVSSINNSVYHLNVSVYHLRIQEIMTGDQLSGD